MKKLKRVTVEAARVEKSSPSCGDFFFSIQMKLPELAKYIEARISAEFEKDVMIDKTWIENGRAKGCLPYRVDKITFSTQADGSFNICGEVEFNGRGAGGVLRYYFNMPLGDVLSYVNKELVS